jgi:flagellar hook-length control protein FliK
VSSVASEASAVRHAHLGQAPRSNFPSAESSDQASPFASLVDGASDPSPPPPASPSPPSQKPAARPPDGHAAQSSSAETALGPQKSPSDSPTPENQAGSVSSPPLKGADGTTVIAEIALGALAKNAAKDTSPTIDANVVTPVTNSATNTSAGSSALDATAGSSTAAAITDIHGDKTAKPDSSTSESAQAAAPTPYPSVNQLIPVAPPPIAVPVSAPVIAAAPTMSGSGTGSDSGTGQDAGQIAAMSDAMAGALRGQADRADAAAAKSGSATADTRTGGSTKPGAKKADAATATPALTPQPAPKDLISATGAGQANAADGAQPRNSAGVSANEAAANHARQRAVTSQPADGSAGPQANSNANSNGNSNVDPNVDPKRDPAASANQIEDITRQALDTTVRRVEAPATETAGGGAPHPGGVEAGSAQQSPDGSGGLAAPAILTTSAAPTSAPMASATPTAIPIAGLAVEIASHARAGKNRFEIRLDPPELGRIDVRLDVDREGKVTSRLVVDRPETLDMLRRDAPALERSLQQAGLKTADNALQFSLRDQGGFGGQNPYPNNGSPAAPTRVIIPDRELPPVAATTAGYGRLTGTSAGIDIRV